jgi:NitT/TauT family transport system permease protein
MLSAQANFEVPLVFAGLLVLAFEGIVMYAIFAAIEQRTAKWAYRSHQ